MKHQVDMQEAAKETAAALVRESVYLISKVLTKQMGALMEETIMQMDRLHDRGTVYMKVLDSFEATLRDGSPIDRQRWLKLIEQARADVRKINAEVSDSGTGGRFDKN